MTFLLLLLIAVCLWGIRFPGYRGDYLSPESTTMVKGIFTFLILFSHARGYLTLSDRWTDTVYLTVQDHLGQLIVAMFLFYSGFGIRESFRKKTHYAQTFLSRRFLKVLLHFDIAVALYILVQAFIPVRYPARNYLLCWIGWEDVGNSNWFIFVILSLYLIAWGGMCLQRRCGKGGIPFTVLATAALWVLLRVVARKEFWWVDTLAAFPLGMLVSDGKDALDGFLRRKGGTAVATAVALVAFALAHKFFGTDVYGGATCLFCCLVVVLSSWIRVGNPVLAWAGRNAFTVYIIQRLPMIVAAALGLDGRPGLFLLFVIPITFLLAEGLSRLYGKIDPILFARG